MHTTTLLQPRFRLALTCAALGLLTALGLSACSKLEAPVPGEYRAYVELRGGQVPFQLRIGNDHGQPQVSLLQDGKAIAATGVSMQDGVLTAQLPQGAGSLRVTPERKSLKGELRITDAQGLAQALPFAADLGASYRFLEKGNTDNVDASGDWLLETPSTGHFVTPVKLQLTQSHDAIDGVLQLDANTALPVVGQASGDQVFFSAIGHGRALLFKGEVTAQGELKGELWHNLDAAHAAIARRAATAAGDASEDALRQVALPWAVPTREMAPLSQ